MVATGRVVVVVVGALVAVVVSGGALDGRYSSAASVAGSIVPVGGRFWAFW